MVIWPWRRFQKDAAFIETLQGHLRASQQFCVEHTAARVQLVHEAEVAAIHFRTTERDLERLGNEHNTLQADFKHLVAQVAGRVPSRHGQLDPDVFERDPFAENLKIPSEWLTDDPEELLNSGEGEASVPGRPSESEGDPGKTVA